MAAYFRNVTVTVPRGRLDVIKDFYTDVLGLAVCQDTQLNSKVDSALYGIGSEMVLRLVMLRSGNKSVGMLGLLEQLEPVVETAGFEKEPGMPYPLCLVFHCENLPEIHRRALAAGCVFVQQPRTGDLPRKGWSRDMVVLDPNSVWVELNDFSMLDAAVPRALPVRRVAFPIGSGTMQTSLDFYQGVLGMDVFYDNDSRGQAANSSLGVGDWHMHFVALTLGSSAHGLVGLMEFLSPQMDVRPYSKAPNAPYPVTLVYAVDSIAEVYTRLRQSKTQIICPPVSHYVPQVGFSTDMTCLDPNGLLVQFTQCAEQ